jgi:hypothetical protein
VILFAVKFEFSNQTVLPLCNLIAAKKAKTSKTKDQKGL